MQDSWKFMEISSRNLVLFDTKRWEIEFSFKTRTREEDRNVVGACTRGPSGWFPLTRQINKVVFAAPSSFQESGTESVASLAADFRSPRLPHLLRVLLARFPGQTTIEHIHSPFIRSSTTCHPNCYIFSHQCFKRNLTIDLELRNSLWNRRDIAKYHLIIEYLWLVKRWSEVVSTFNRSIRVIPPKV